MEGGGEVGKWGSGRWIHTFTVVVCQLRRLGADGDL